VRRRKRRFFLYERHARHPTAGIFAVETTLRPSGLMRG
jgi:hypothetical protein